VPLFRQRRRGRGLEPTNYPACDMDCARCIRLNAAQCDQCVRLVSIEGGRGLRRRLAELGIAPGCEVRVLQNYGGPLILAVKEDARMALGREMARRILVRPVEELR